MNANKRLKTAMCVVFMFYLTVNVFGKPVSESLFWKACCVKELRKLEMLLILRSNGEFCIQIDLVNARPHVDTFCLSVCLYVLSKLPKPCPTAEISLILLFRVESHKVLSRKTHCFVPSSERALFAESILIEIILPTHHVYQHCGAYDSDFVPCA